MGCIAYSAKLDSVPRQEWGLLNVNEFPSFTAFSDFIQQRAQFLESVEQTTRNSAYLAQASAINNKENRLVTHLYEQRIPHATTVRELI